ncbi:Oidioi.mRNA.OKI2018_I69.chr1.g1488.t1.cds [Oikopleura dioica]|uniref:Oidioi.mRNA.OKI2018_I69.chr1.g1488.t1.cds n=1 Tax=Oikopleura dioica TaxID=34765 RepID=A0ABN7SSB3_OIKDI|nr:Oidioi.mRNA.OKI2018_I69.chr1.g1488.t1.cds [Oikopleura dioica]
MSEKSYYSESFLSDDTVVPNSALIEQLRSEMKAESNKVNEKVRLLQLKLSDADMENTDHKKRIAELENTVENQGLKIDQLEKTLEEKVLENEMQTLNVSSEMKIFKPAQKPAAFQENYGLHEKQLEILQEYGCLGHFTENDEFEDYGGNKYTDQTSFALMMKAYKNGLKEFTLKGEKFDSKREFKSWMLLRVLKREYTIGKKLTLKVFTSKLFFRRIGLTEEKNGIADII